MTTFSPKRFYGDHTESLQMQVARDEHRWLERHQPDLSADTLLVFGCGVQYTPHLMREAVAVFEVLGLDTVAVAHRQFCCGRPLRRVGNESAAQQIVAASYRRFSEYGPRVAVQWCGACMLTFHDVVEGELEQPFAVKHVSQFVAEHLRDRAAELPWIDAPPRTVLVHEHMQRSYADAEKQGPEKVNAVAPPSVMSILGSIPSVSVRGLVDPPKLGLPCEVAVPGGPWNLDEIDAAEYRGVQDELRAQLAGRRANTIVTPFHACQRNWSKLAGKNLHVMHWMSVLAEALGVGSEDRFQTYWQLREPRAIVEAARPRWESWGIDETEALAAAEKYFTADYGEAVAQCDCGGRGCGPDEPPLFLPLT